MKLPSHPSVLRIQQHLQNQQVYTQVLEFEQPTRTSVQAAQAIGCSPAEIAKSIVFRIGQSQRVVLVVASGDNRVSERKVAKYLGEPVGKADADLVRLATGFPIGGVAPIGHTQNLVILLDQDLQRFERVWAAAGTPNAVFSIAPQDLQRICAAQWVDVREDVDKEPRH